MTIWNEYPTNYRRAETTEILTAVRSGECVSIIGLSGSGKSNLVGFLAHRMESDSPTMILLDGNRAQPRSAAGLFRLARKALGAPDSAQDDYTALEYAIGCRMMDSPSGLCLLFDRYDALDPEERAQASGPLRALRDTFKYQLTYVLVTRRTVDPDDELAELFYAHAVWLGPLSTDDSLWSIGQYASRHGYVWNEQVKLGLINLSWGYPSLLRACCEAYSAGVPLEMTAMREHPAIQRRVREFWADGPSAEDLRRSRLAGHPLLEVSPGPVHAASPDLTAAEHRLLAFLQDHPGVVCTKDDLIRAVWPEDRVTDGLRDDSLAQLIRRLRQKIEPDAGSPRYILTVPGRGYRYVE